MKIWLTIILLASTLLPGCTSGDKKASELLDTAAFEEKQNNFEHASKLYDEILKEYPQSQAAKSAANRLTGLRHQKP